MTLRFEVEPAAVPAVPERADIACFVGFVRRSGLALPGDLQRSLVERGHATPDQDGLRHIPVPVETWDLFDHLFDWRGPTAPLAAALRSFFASGGRRAYLVRAGDPPADGKAGESAEESLARLLPGYPFRLDVNPRDRKSWKGFGAIAGLDDISFISLPDLPSILAIDEPALEPLPEPSPGPERFVTCSSGLPGSLPEPGETLESSPPPRLDAAAFRHWGRALSLAAGYLALHHREALLVASLPLPAPEVGDLHLHLIQDGLLNQALEPGADRASATGRGLASAFVQLAYPWLRTERSADQPGGVEAPEGFLVGLLAENALTQGTFRSAAGRRVSGQGSSRSLEAAGVIALEPRLDRGATHTEYLGWRFFDRVTFFAPSSRGFELISDVTTSLEPGHRPAAVSRLIGVVLRASRLLGETILFEPSGPGLWSRVRAGMEQLLGRLYASGALFGEKATDAFEVRCDRTTMGAADIENGRLIAEVRLRPSAPVDEITVVLALQGGAASRDVA